MITREYVRSTAVASAPMTVGCTRCLAPRGSYCRSTPRRGDGYQNSAVGFHKPRVEAVAHLSEQQRYDAYVQMRREEQPLRESVSRSLRPFPAPPVPAADLAAERAKRQPLAPFRGAKVLDLRPRLAARHAAPPQDIA